MNSAQTAYLRLMYITTQDRIYVRDKRVQFFGPPTNRYNQWFGNITHNRSGVRLTGPTPVRPTSKAVH